MTEQLLIAKGEDKEMSREIDVHEIYKVIL